MPCRPVIYVAVSAALGLTAATAFSQNLPATRPVTTNETAQLKEQVRQLSAKVDAIWEWGWSSASISTPIRVAVSR